MAMANRILSSPTIPTPSDTLTVLPNDGVGGFISRAVLRLASYPQIGVSRWGGDRRLHDDGTVDLACANNHDTTLSELLPVDSPASKLSLTAVSGTNHIALSWSSIFTNSLIQTTTNPSNPNWQTGGYPGTIANDRNMSTAITSPPRGSLYFRLVTP
jgi:hypothetical protein